MMRELRKNLIFELTKYLERVTYASKTTLYTKGDRSDYFYFLRKGSVLVHAVINVAQRGKRSQVGAWYTQQELFGEERHQQPSP